MEKIATLEDAIKQNSLVGIYSVFYTIVHGDPNFSTNKFYEIFQYVKTKNIKGFLQEFDGEEFEPEENWNKEYWAFVASSLIDNFCVERIHHLEQVGKKVYPLKMAELPKSSSVANKDIVKSKCISKNDIFGNRQKTMPFQKTKLISEEKKQKLKSDYKNRHKAKRGGIFNQGR